MSKLLMSSRVTLIFMIHFALVYLVRRSQLLSQYRFKTNWTAASLADTLQTPHQHHTSTSHIPKGPVYEMQASVVTRTCIQTVVRSCGLKQNFVYSHFALSLPVLSCSYRTNSRNTINAVAMFCIKTKASPTQSHSSRCSGLCSHHDIYDYSFLPPCFSANTLLLSLLCLSVIGL